MAPSAAPGLLTALVVGGVAFLPWLPTMLYQGANTGTPWGDPVRPATFVVLGLIYLAGGAVAEPQLVAYLFAGLIVLGVLGTTNRRGRLELGWRIRPNAQPEAAVVVVTLGLAWAAAFATGSAIGARSTQHSTFSIVVIASRGPAAMRRLRSAFPCPLRPIRRDGRRVARSRVVAGDRGPAFDPHADRAAPGSPLVCAENSCPYSPSKPRIRRSIIRAAPSASLGGAR